MFLISSSQFNIDAIQFIKSVDAAKLVLLFSTFQFSLLNSSQDDQIIMQIIYVDYISTLINVMKP